MSFVFWQLQKYKSGSIFLAEGKENALIDDWNQSARNLPVIVNNCKNNKLPSLFFAPFFFGITKISFLVEAKENAQVHDWSQLL